MPGLSFLNKKGWHTGSFKNRERKWVAEQKAEAEKKKMEELKKKYAEEREKMELARHVGGGEGKKKKIERLDWMYRGQSGNATSAASSEAADKAKAEEFLLGKKIEDNSHDKIGDFGKLKMGNVPGA